MQVWRSSERPLCSLPASRLATTFLHRRKSVRAALHLASSSPAPRKHLFPSVLAVQESLLGSQARGGTNSTNSTNSISCLQLTLSRALWEFPSREGGNPRTEASARVQSSWRPRWLHPLLHWQRTVLLPNHLHWHGSGAMIAVQKLPLTTMLLSSLTWDQRILPPPLLPLAKLNVGSPRREVACTHCLAWGGRGKKCRKHASTKHRKGCFSFIVEISKIGET